MSVNPQAESPYEDNVSLSPSPPAQSEMPGEEEEEDNYEDSLDLDTSRAGSSVWLVRLPKFLMERWKDIESFSDTDLGVVKTTSRPGKPEKIKLALNAGLELQDIPYEYDINLVKQVVDNTYVFTEQDLPKFNNNNHTHSSENNEHSNNDNKNNNYYNKDKKLNQGTLYAEGMAEAEAGGQSQDGASSTLGTSGKTASSYGKNKDQRFVPYVKTIPKKTALVGTVRHECQLTPSLQDANYSKVLSKRKQMESGNSRAKVTFLNDLPGVNTSMFGTGMKGNSSAFLRSQKKDSTRTEGKAIRIPKNELLDWLFKLFEEYDYWSMKGLRERTKQPEVYLKEVLDTMAVLIKKGPYAMKYSLKPEFKQIKGMGSSLSEYMGGGSAPGSGGSGDGSATGSIGSDSNGASYEQVGNAEQGFNVDNKEDDVEMETVF